MTNTRPDDVHIVQEKVDFLPPDRVTDDRSILTLKSLVMEPLCAWTDGRVEAGLFDRWEVDETGCVWTFHLRPDPVFHDGHRCTARDVVDFVDAISASVDTFGMKWSYARYFAHARFVAASESTMRVTTARPMGDLPEIFTEFYLSRTDPEGNATIGTGPFRVDAFTRATSVRLSDAQGRRMRIDALPNAEARLAEVVAGRADIACQLDCLERLPRREGPLQWIHATHCLSVMAYLNCARGLFASDVARRAVNLAIDRQSLCRQVYHGLARPAATIVSPWHCGASQAGLHPIDYDPDTARAMLRTLDFREELVLRTPTYMPEHAVGIAHVIKDALQHVGLEVRIDVADDRPGYARAIGRKDMGDIAIFDSSPHSTFRVLNDKISSSSRGVWWQGFDDPALEGLITTANETIDPQRRAVAYGRCLSALQTNPPWLYLVHPETLAAARAGLGGLSVDHKGIMHFTKEAFS
ncbi:hypothetical protein KGY14_13110 [Ameyamaea chiangmaiensis]|uniref:Solute-binding protein family 5 domain-containing protein n=1 Tax=Ameyamaea chiangmaiensis TaxID=442969 RepID=A0A850P4S4_9PROT|nr:ABC transporter substrate-binding protein [Ameyamaea chiangmaiensis]MBS4076130.1 hypothetical protein [Ameyamaea chiangmaiensis]NVN39645.1 hypothetical protein [Ameyamaea chiangmaiensis]